MRNILLLFFISFNCLAQVKYTEKGQPAEYTGYLFTVDKELEVRTKLLDLDYQLALNQSKSREVDLYKAETLELNNQIGLYKTSTNDLIKQTMDSNKNTFWGGFAYFLLGAGVTTLITYGVRR